jgi:hypothetical protein
MSICTSTRPLPLAMRTLALAALSGGPALAQTVTVTTSSDAIDIDPATGTVAALPGPDGVVSFSEALIATNNTPGHQTIEFALTGSTMLSSITGTYWRANDTVTIDATTQPGGVQLWHWGLSLNAPDCTAKGFKLTSMAFTTSNGLAIANTGGSNISLVGSGGHRAEGNDVGTIKIDGGSSNNVVVGNTVKQVSVFGGSNNVVGGPDLADRNFITGFGSLSISQGLPSGTTVGVGNTTGTVIENNYIGTTVDGLSQGNPYSTIGIGITGFNDDLIIRDNLIAGIKATGIGTWAGAKFGHAVLLWGWFGGTNIEISGNTIGLDANGNPTLGSVWGIDVGNAYGSGVYTDVRILDNVVAGHSLNGITVGDQIPNARIQRNSVYGNGWLGIDLIIPNAVTTTGVTLNDPLDLDTGGNGLQNFPEIATAELDGGGTLRVTGSLHSSPLDVFTLEFFASPECDESGFGEGEVFLGQTSVTTDAAGDASFDVTYATTVPEGWLVTSTATLEPLGATSEHSACATITGPFCQPDLGFGGPGTATLSVCGDVLASGGSADLAVVGAPAFAGVWVGFGAASNPTPIVGGTFVPFPPALVWPLGADASGEAHLAIPGGGFAAHTVYAQAVYVDLSLPELIGFTNAVGIEILP